MTGTFEGVGTLQFSPDNKHAYAYSGNIVINNTTTTLLSFTTQSEYLDAVIYWYGRIAHIGSSKIVQQFVFFNGINIFDYSRLTGAGTGWADLDPTPFIIPPFTDVIIQLSNDNAGDIIYGANLMAKVKGAIEQENLEAITDNNKWASK